MHLDRKVRRVPDAEILRLRAQNDTFYRAQGAGV
jgi:hypothetical protein